MQELLTLGLPSIVSQSNSEFEEVKAVAVIQKLILLHRHNLKIITEQKDRFACFLVFFCLLFMQ